MLSASYSAKPVLAAMNTAMKKNPYSNSVHIKYVFCHNVASALKKSKVWKRAGGIKS